MLRSLLLPILKLHIQPHYLLADEYTVDPYYSVLVLVVKGDHLHLHFDPSSARRPLEGDVERKDAGDYGLGKVGRRNPHLSIEYI